jgi:uncharacterized protein with GYD domain
VVAVEGGTMSRYVLLTTLTAEGRKTLHKDPSATHRVNDEIHAFGCEVIEQYAVLGPYDFVTLVDAPDNATMAHLSVDLGSRGTVNILTLPAIEVGEFEKSMSGGKQLGHD